MGQLNGIRHGWMSGFEAGQVNGIKRVFREAYLHNVNLFERLQDEQEERETESVLDLISARDLQAEGMNTFIKTFHQ